jgi:hypothetical protein
MRLTNALRESFDTFLKGWIQLKSSGDSTSWGLSFSKSTPQVMNIDA